MATRAPGRRQRGGAARAQRQSEFTLRIGESVSADAWEDATAQRIVDLIQQVKRARNTSIDARDCARIALELMTRMGARFSTTQLPCGDLRLVNSHCPFEEANEAFLNECACQIASNVCTGRNAHDASAPQLEFNRCRLAHDNCCEILVHNAGHFSSALKNGPRPDQGSVQGLSMRDSAGTLGQGESRIWRPTKQPPVSAGFSSDLEIVAASHVMQRLLESIVTIGPTSATVLITGETGVGKELAAKALHATNERANHVFLALNCGTIPETLIESTLFGHERGAFTGAHKTTRGVFERAKGGTLFLDEIDALSLAAQTRLLRVLQEGEYERVGGQQPLRSNVRLIVATNRPLETAIEEGSFRRDLYYRIHVVPLVIPPLRERPEDIPCLLQHILGKLSRRYGKRITSVSREVMEALIHHDWPGNVRELENVLERAFLFSAGPELQLGMPMGNMTASDPLAAELSRPWNEQKKRTLARLEKRYLQAALHRWKGDVRRVAETMGLTPRAIYLKLRHYDLEAHTYRN